MNKLNCWEHMKCGRELGGVYANELGACPASIEQRTNGLNGGKNGGRACWAIAGTLCGGYIQGSYALKLNSCVSCEFHKLVLKEEDSNFVPTKDILLKLGKKQFK